MKTYLITEDQLKSIDSGFIEPYNFSDFRIAEVLE